MTAEAAEWGEHDISRRFYAGTPHDELTRLAATFDALLERVAQSLQREQRLTAEISHELRTPLAKVLAEAELASDLSRPRSTMEYRRAAASIRTAAEQLSKSLDMLLAAARADHTGTPSTVDARAIADRAAESQRGAALRHGVSIEVSGSPTRTRVGVEPALLERALVPILDNAVRHARRRVAISVSDHDRQLVFEINDDGPGIDPAIQGQMFEPGVSAANGGASGAGLGLPLARRLARAARGEIECDSQPTGARFTVRFPLA
jgi:signal transduction histidine kinase